MFRQGFRFSAMWFSPSSSSMPSESSCILVSCSTPVLTRLADFEGADC